MPPHPGSHVKHSAAPPERIAQACMLPGPIPQRKRPWSCDQGLLVGGRTWQARTADQRIKRGRNPHIYQPLSPPSLANVRRPMPPCTRAEHCSNTSFRITGKILSVRHPWCSRGGIRTANLGQNVQRARWRRAHGPSKAISCGVSTLQLPLAAQPRCGPPSLTLLGGLIEAVKWSASAGSQDAGQTGSYRLKSRKPPGPLILALAQ
jgi:hypothetical protein